MKTVQSVDNVTIKVSKEELINNKWLTFQLLSKKLAEIEESKKMEYKYVHPPRRCDPVS